MPWTFTVMELSVLVLSVVLFGHARKEGKQWLSTYVCGILFGTSMELLLVSGAKSSYSYGTFWLMIGGAHKVPVWVGVGWGAILYASTWTAQRLAAPRWLRPLAAGLLAVNIDLSLDPIAEKLGFWNWSTGPGQVTFYGVPFDNFLGWFAIVATYSFFVREGFHRVKPTERYSYLWIPPLAAVLAIISMIGIGSVASFAYRAVGSQTPVFVAVFAAACVLSWQFAKHSRRNLPYSRPILAVPVVMHGLLYALLFLSKSFESEVLSSLIVLIPVNFAVGFFGFAWVSLDTLFPPLAEHVALRSSYGPPPETSMIVQRPDVPGQERAGGDSLTG
jgi:uncharacterized membrane protein